ncbi:MAG: hypothetical protein P4L33_15130 [Capsulimonadaceae bacterium]|nr:hypothetical protein [Capsulimonadaceae bacterium]
MLIRRAKANRALIWLVALTFVLALSGCGGSSASQDAQINKILHNHHLTTKQKHDLIAVVQAQHAFGAIILPGVGVAVFGLFSIRVGYKIYKLKKQRDLEKEQYRRRCERQLKAMEELYAPKPPAPEDPYVILQRATEAIPIEECTMSFFTSRPMAVSDAVDVTLIIRGTVVVVDVDRTEFVDIRAGRMPLVRTFSIDGVTRPWYEWDGYFPYKHYWPSVSQGWAWPDSRISCGWTELDQLEPGIPAYTSGEGRVEIDWADVIRRRSGVLYRWSREKRSLVKALNPKLAVSYRPPRPLSKVRGTAHEAALIAGLDPRVRAFSLVKHLRKSRAPGGAYADRKVEVVAPEIPRRLGALSETTRKRRLRKSLIEIRPNQEASALDKSKNAASADAAHALHKSLVKLDVDANEKDAAQIEHSEGAVAQPGAQRKRTKPRKPSAALPDSKTWTPPVDAPVGWDEAPRVPNGAPMWQAPDGTQAFKYEPARSQANEAPAQGTAVAAEPPPFPVAWADQIKALHKELEESFLRAREWNAEPPANDRSSEESSVDNEDYTDETNQEPLSVEEEVMPAGGVAEYTREEQSNANRFTFVEMDEESVISGEPYESHTNSHRMDFLSDEGELANAASVSEEALEEYCDPIDSGSIAASMSASEDSEDAAAQAPQGPAEMTVRDENQDAAVIEQPAPLMDAAPVIPDAETGTGESVPSDVQEASETSAEKSEPPAKRRAYRLRYRSNNRTESEDDAAPLKTPSDDQALPLAEDSLVASAQESSLPAPEIQPAATPTPSNNEAAAPVEPAKSGSRFKKRKSLRPPAPREVQYPPTWPGFPNPPSPYYAPPGYQTAPYPYPPAGAPYPVTDSAHPPLQAPSPLAPPAASEQSPPPQWYAAPPNGEPQFNGHNGQQPIPWNPAGAPPYSPPASPPSYSNGHGAPPPLDTTSAEGVTGESVPQGPETTSHRAQHAHQSNLVRASVGSGRVSPNHRRRKNAKQDQQNKSKQPAQPDASEALLQILKLYTQTQLKDAPSKEEISPEGILLKLIAMSSQRPELNLDDLKAVEDEDKRSSDLV